MTATEDALLATILAPALDPLFWRSARKGVESAWYGHVPFAHWLVRAAAPRCIVELGTHNGVSYTALCEAVQRAGLATRCFAVDSWRGDDHAGCYGDEVYDDLRAFHDPRYGAFSTLLRSDFDGALPLIPDGSVDLLHIDGRHGYEDVRHDFESWRGKLSNRAVVLFHDTNVRDAGFGVWRLWSELQQESPGFEFLHAHGLGVLAPGGECPDAVMALAGLRDPVAIGTVRERFAQLGERCVMEARSLLLARMQGQTVQERDTVQGQLAVVQAEAGRLRASLAELRGALTEVQAAAEAAHRAAAAAHADAAATRAQWQELAGAEAASRERAVQADAACLRAEGAAIQAGQERLALLARDERQRHAMRLAQTQAAAERGRAAHAQAALRAVQAAHQAEAGRRAAIEGELATVQSSGIWRATRPLRRVLSLVPPGGRRIARTMLQSGWRAVTPHLNGLRIAAPPLPAPAASPAPPLPALPPLRVASVQPRICYVSGEPDTPGTNYRVGRYAASCREAGAEVTVLRLDGVAAALPLAEPIDLLLIWRAVWTEPLAELVGQVRDAGGRVVFDVDDLMIDPALAITEVIDGIRSQHLKEPEVQAHYTEVQRTMLQADFCTATTAELAGHMRRFGKPAFVLPNGFDRETLHTARMAARRRRATSGDGLVRLGYASGSRTHQRDFAVVAASLPELFRAHPNARLVLFQANEQVKLLDMHEYPELLPFADRIEWRSMVPLDRLPEEIARFDVNLAPLEPGNLFCEAKSELKYFEGALAGVCTVASPVGPYVRAIRHGVTGFLASTTAQWTEVLTRLLADPALRDHVARRALDDVLWSYGPDRRAQLMRRLLAEWQGGPAAADAFLLETGRTPRLRPAPEIPAGSVAFATDRLRQAEVTVAIPLHNYAHTVIETLDSVRMQSLLDLDLIVVDDASTDASLQTVLDWAAAHASRFNRLLVIRNDANAGLGPTRNAAFSAAETEYVLPLDADNLLRPGCCELLLRAAQLSGAAVAYPVIQEFGARTRLIGTAPYDPARLVGGNYIDAMALVAKSAWSAVGGYGALRLGWEDYDFWCALAEAGLFGVAAGGAPLADYRAHDASMLAQVTDTEAAKHRVIATIEKRHPWTAVARPLAPRRAERPTAAVPPQAVPWDGDALETTDSSPGR